MWYITYTREDYLDQAKQELRGNGIVYHVPTNVVTTICPDGTFLVDESPAFANLILVKTNGDIDTLISQNKNLFTPYTIPHTRRNAIVSDAEMDLYLPILTNGRHGVRYLDCPYSNFSNYLEIRFSKGDLQGVTGRKVRLHVNRSGHRMLVINLGSLAVAIDNVNFDESERK